jgi:hypothetical protein
MLELRDDFSILDKKLAEHEVRFGNGREVMGDMKKDIEKLKPKAPDWVKVLGVGLGLLATTLGAHYWLIEQFNDRPTNYQLEKAFREHAETGHESTHHNIAGIRETQVVQQATLETLGKTVSAQGQKLDIIIERLPHRRRDQ